MDHNMKFMILFFLMSLVVACVQFLLAKDKVKALPNFIIPIGLGVIVMIAAVVR